MHLRRTEGKIEFVFSKELLTYSENSKVLASGGASKPG